MAVFAPPSPIPAGLSVALEQAGFTGVTLTPAGMYADDSIAAAVQSFISAFAGSAAQLAVLRAEVRRALKAHAESLLDEYAIIAGGSVAITGAQLDAYKAAIYSNGRALLASINAAATAAALAAVSITGGWPAAI